MAATFDINMYPVEDPELTEEAAHYDHWNQVPRQTKKYYGQRYDIFSLYDEGVFMTEDAWFGVTPEAVANQIAQDLPWDKSTGHGILVDLFGGAGGNTIAFALSGRWDRIICIEKDPATLACAQYNADIYGVPTFYQQGNADPEYSQPDQEATETAVTPITWILGDCFEYLESVNPKNAFQNLHGFSVRVRQGEAVLFASPPWGGPSYTSTDVFDLEAMEPYGLSTIHKATRLWNHALFLPRTSDLRQLAHLVPDRHSADKSGQSKIDIVQYCVHGFSKGLVAYYPTEQLFYGIESPVVATDPKHIRALTAEEASKSSSQVNSSTNKRPRSTSPPSQAAGHESGAEADNEATPSQPHRRSRKRKLGL